MNKKELIQALATKTGMTQKDCEAVYGAFLDTIAEKLNEETAVKVTIPGLGTIKVKVKEAHQSRNPRTKELVDVPAKREARMSLSDTLKNKLVQKF